MHETSPDLPMISSWWYRAVVHRSLGLQSLLPRSRSLLFQITLKVSRQSFRFCTLCERVRKRLWRITSWRPIVTWRTRALVLINTACFATQHNDIDKHWFCLGFLDSNTHLLLSEIKTHFFSLKYPRYSSVKKFKILSVCEEWCACIMLFPSLYWYLINEDREAIFIPLTKNRKIRTCTSTRIRDCSCGCKVTRTALYYNQFINVINDNQYVPCRLCVYGGGILYTSVELFACACGSVLVCSRARVFVCVRACMCARTRV